MWPRDSSDEPGDWQGTRLLPGLTPHCSPGAGAWDSPRLGLGEHVTTQWGSRRWLVEQSGGVSGQSRAQMCPAVQGSGLVSAACWALTAQVVISRGRAGF